ncbi:alpha/beta hydrolase [Streptomyces albidoflavus]|uniref:alpha/beta fold hydrolase n=1 Tax=Streptomyces albidoflavus TaxID=1886 RepID=UPI0033EA9549
MGTYEVDGVQLAYEEWGPEGGVPVVLVHGHPFDRSLWRAQAQRLAGAGCRVVLPDLRGYGESQVVPGRTPFPVFAGDVAALLDRLGMGQALVGGVSMGGQITMEIRRLYPERVRALVLADTSYPAETEEGRAGRLALAERLLAEGMGGYADEVIGKMVASYNVGAKPEATAHVLRMMRATDPEGAAAALRGRADREDYEATLAGVSEPVLIVVGADDAFTTVADAEAIRRLVPHATLTVIPGAGHLPHLEQPEETGRALVGFVTGLG